jgi:hypothetical protein
LVGYNVFIDGLFVEKVTEENYTFTGEEKIYNFCITALHTIDGVDCESNKICEDIEVIIVVEAPINLTATPLSSSEIKLEWEYTGATATFILFRDDAMIAENIVATEYTDTELITEVEYCYIVKAAIGEHMSEPSNEACTETVGINDISTMSVQIYPNPANNTLYIEGEGLKTITIYNLLGQAIETIETGGDTVTSVNTSSYQPAMYLVEIVMENGKKINKRVVIVR